VAPGAPRAPHEGALRALRRPIVRRSMSLLRAGAVLALAVVAAVCPTLACADDRGDRVDPIAALPSMPFKSLISEADVSEAASNVDGEQHLLLLPIESLLRPHESKRLTGLAVWRGQAVRINGTNATNLEGAPAIAGSTLSSAHPVPLKMWEILRETIKKDFEIAIKVMCVIGNVLNQASAYPAIRKINAAGDTGEVDALPFLSILLNTCQWCFYGVFAWRITKISGFLIALYSNIFGVMAAAFYVFSFHRNCHNPKSREVLMRYYRNLLITFGIHVTSLIVLSLGNALIFTGFMAALSGAVCYLSQLSTLPTVIRTNSTASMNPAFSVGSFFSALVWLLCGVMVNDWWIITPNAIGLISSTVALTVILVVESTSESPYLGEKTPLVHQKGGDWCASPLGSSSVLKKV